MASGSTQKYTHALNESGNCVKRLSIIVKGIVQGVGFRPFVFQLAKSNRLNGFVTNSSKGVEIELEGSTEQLNRFLTDLESNAPPLSQISDVSCSELPLKHESGFNIVETLRGEKPATLISPDIAVCKDCLKELFDPKNRRFHYPFINCTNCGPRYTIIDQIPYDRPYTSMKHFTMCPSCDSEYHDPMNRRFHAQPNACEDCGPEIGLYLPDQKQIETPDPIGEARAYLKAGHILAIKGLGGFHLCCDARNETAIQTLRRRKHREEKPFAIMVRSLETAKRHCTINADEESLLMSKEAPIVLLKKSGKALAPSLAPGNDRLGIMLPYTPLHHLLFEDQLETLVMTSANLSDEPICINNDEAFSRLNGIADFFLIHNREIYLRCDDSVVAHMGEKIRFLRRSRGFVPKPVHVGSTGAPILATGAELKNTVCLLKGDQAFLSQHIGDLVNLEAYEHFQKTIAHFERIFETRPELVVHDLHPNMLSTTWAAEQDVPTLSVQHHHAHLATVMAEHQLQGPVIGIILDGTGYGTDGSIWGGEILIGTPAEVRRYACFEPMPLPGGDAAIKAPWRTALSYLNHAFDGRLPELGCFEGFDTQPILEMIRHNINCPLTSSAGRLFDAVAVISGGKPQIRYEAQAAIEFMQRYSGLEEPSFDIQIEHASNVKHMMISPIIRSAVKAVQEGASQSVLSNRFHRTLIEMLKTIALKAKQETGIRQVALSGGVFQNHILFEGLILALEHAGFEVFTHHLAPTNDGGISFGQTLIGRTFLEGNYKGFVG